MKLKDVKKEKRNARDDKFWKKEAILFLKFPINFFPSTILKVTFSRSTNSLNYP